MDSTVVVRKSALDYFRKKARDSAYEIHAYLIGEYVHPNKFIIRSIEHARSYEQQDSGTVQPTVEDFLRAREKAEEDAFRIIGDIHSHPDYEAIMSPADYRACLEDNLQICGIVSVIKDRTKVRFWQVNSALQCEVVYSGHERPRKKKS